jgi:hypothetical protein
MEKNYSTRIHELRKELREEITRLLNKHKLKSVTIPEDVDENVSVVWIDEDGYAYDSRVAKIFLDDDGKIALEVEDCNSPRNVTLYTGNDIALEHVEWLENICSMLEYLLEGDEWHICSECGALMDEGFYNGRGHPVEYYCSEECLHKHYSENEWTEMCREGLSDEQIEDGQTCGDFCYYTKWRD